MSDEIRLITAIAAASLVALSATPFAIRIANRLGFLDVPSGYKRHGAPTPYLGGAAVLLGLLTGYFVAGDFGRLGVVAAGAALLWAVGSLDDLVNLRPELRVLAEAAAAIVIWADGIRFPLFDNEIASLVVTVLWIVAVVNAFNLMDNIDGAACSVAAVSGVMIAGLALVADDVAVATLAAALAGSCAAFLYFNLARPARIFLGDGGSMAIGFTLGACAMLAADGAGEGWTAAAAAILVVGVPAADTALVIVSRRRRHVPILTGARDHLTHRLLRRLRSERVVAASLALGQAVLGAWALVLVQVRPTVGHALFTAGVVLLGLVAALALHPRMGLRRVPVSAGGRLRQR